jgi:DNA repair protein RadC
MSFVVNDSCLESLSAIAAQHEDWIIQQAIVLLERRVFKAGPCLTTGRRAGLPASETGR